LKLYFAKVALDTPDVTVVALNVGSVVTETVPEAMLIVPVVAGIPVTRTFTL